MFKVCLEMLNCSILFPLLCAFQDIQKVDLIYSVCQKSPLCFFRFILIKGQMDGGIKYFDHFFFVRQVMSIHKRFGMMIYAYWMGAALELYVCILN